MANTDSAKKAIRSDARKRMFNDRRRITMKQAVKAVRGATEAGDTKKAEELLPEAQKAIDKAAKRGVIKKNAASRKKSRLAALVKREGE